MGASGVARGFVGDGRLARVRSPVHSRPRRHRLVDISVGVRSLGCLRLVFRDGGFSHPTTNGSAIARLELVNFPSLAVAGKPKATPEMPTRKLVQSDPIGH